jgi:DNA-binding transcriptional ArsR family regulator
MSLNKTFKALADPTRREILKLLHDHDLAAGELAKKFTITFPSLSHHLGVLKQAGLVTGQRQGQQQIYSLNLSMFEELMTKYFDQFK